MKTFLLPNYFKRIGLVLCFLGIIAGFFTNGVDDFIAGAEEAYHHHQNQHVAEFSSDDSEPSEHVHFGITWTEGWIRFFDLCFIGGVLIYALSGEKKEDELFRTLRLETGWITFVIFLAIIFIIYAIWGEIKFALSYILGFPLILFLLIFHFRKASFAQD